MVEPKIAWYSLLKKPILDRVFYVPFWDCPYMCEFCCVDSMPGKPPGWPDEGEALLFEMIALMAARYKHPIQLHLYGGEPMLRHKYIEHIAERVKTDPNISKLVLYTTLRSRSPKKIVEILGKEKLQILVNEDTINDKVRKELAQLKGIASFHDLPMYLPVGRGAMGEPGYQPENFPGRKYEYLQRILPFGMLNRSCFANVSGPLINVPHRTVHLCCLPQSPVIGNFAEGALNITNNYDTEVRQAPNKMNKACQQEGLHHPCAVCNKHSDYNSTFSVDGYVHAKGEKI